MLCRDKDGRFSMGDILDMLELGRARARVHQVQYKAHGSFEHVAVRACTLTWHALAMLNPVVSGGLVL
jgi:hypothetical protein